MSYSKPEDPECYETVPGEYPAFRNQDNFQNSKQFINEQLSPHNYDDQEELNIAKMKIWVLDGEYRLKEYSENDCHTPDVDVTAPMDHFSTLYNDLSYLDKYIRTEERTLEEDESPFNEFWQERIENKKSFLKTVKDEETQELYEDYEQPYLERPTLLTKQDFSELYEIYTQMTGVTSAFDIVDKASTYCIDHEIKEAEQNYLSHIPKEEMEEQLDAQGGQQIQVNDWNYVKQLQDIDEEMFAIISSYIEEPEPCECHSPEECTCPEPEPTGNMFVNLPERREQVSEDNIKGPVVEEEDFKEGGYRFKYRSLSRSEIEDNFTFEKPAWDRTVELEETWTDFRLTYVQEDPETMVQTLVSAMSYVDISDEDSERFDELNARWKTINHMREKEILNTGTRTIIESMLTAEIPEGMDEDKNNFISEKINQKKIYTDILVDSGDFVSVDVA